MLFRKIYTAWKKFKYTEMSQKDHTSVKISIWSKAGLNSFRKRLSASSVVRRPSSVVRPSFARSVFGAEVRRAVAPSPEGGAAVARSRGKVPAREPGEREA